MNNKNKWFTMVEIIISISIVVLIIWFWFTKVSNFFRLENTLISINEINNTILKSKIESNFIEWENIIYFNKNFKWFYSIYNNNKNKKNSFFINYWSINDDNIITINLKSDDIISSTWSIIIDNWITIISKDIYFSWTWITNDNLSIDFKNIYNTSIYIKDSNNYINTWNIKIYPLSFKNNLELSNIIWINQSNIENDYSLLKMINTKSWKYKYYWYRGENISKLKSIIISFIDNYDNYWNLEFN